MKNAIRHEINTAVPEDEYAGSGTFVTLCGRKVTRDSIAAMYDSGATMTACAQCRAAKAAGR